MVYSLRVDTKTFTLNQPNMIKATIYADEGIATNISKGKVVFKVDGKTLKDSGGKVIYAKVINGTAMIENYTVPDSWNNQTVIQAVYSGSGDLQSLKSDREEIAIALPQPTVTLDDYTAQRGETIRISVNVMQQQTPLSVGKVVLKINGKTLKDSGGKVIYACVDNGLATVDYTIPESMKTKEYVITAVFIANGYERVEKTSKLTIVE